MSESELQKKYLDARSAGKLVGYSSDYVTRLAREKKIDAIQTGRQWLVDADSLKLFSLEAEAEKRRRAAEIKAERKQELVLANAKLDQVELATSLQKSHPIALMQTVALSACLFLFAHLVWFSFENQLGHGQLTAGAIAIFSELEATMAAAPTAISQVASLAFARQSPIEPAAKAMVDDDDDRNDSASSDFQGIVVIENTDETEAQLEDIRRSFSDEVEVEFTGVDTGVIKPVFKTPSSESYRFLLTPLKPATE